MGAALEGSGKPLVITSGTLLLAFIGHLGTEEDIPDAAVPEAGIGERCNRHGRARGAVVGNPSSTVGAQRRGQARLRTEPDRHRSVPRACQASSAMDRTAGLPCIDWMQRTSTGSLWRPLRPARDYTAPARRAFRSAQIAEAIGRQLNVPAVSIAPEEAGDHFGFLFPFVSFDNPTSSALTQERLGWRPVHTALIPDIEEGHYFS